MDRRLARSCISLSATIRDAMVALESGETAIALVCDEGGRLAGTLTDGDLRRALLGGGTLDSPIRPLAQRQFISVGTYASRAEVLDLMNARGVAQIPVLDEVGRVRGLHLLREMLGAVERPNWAVILAGGKGSRLRPVTDKLPKPMVRVAGRPILERIVLHLVGYGIRRIFLAVNYMADVIEAHFGDGKKFGCRIEYLRESKALGTGGPLALLCEPPPLPLLALNGDLIFQFDVSRLFGFHEQGGYAMTVGIHDYTHTVPLGILDVEGSRVKEIQEKPTFSWKANAGIYVLTPQLCARIPKDTPFPLTALIEGCLERGEPVGAHPIEGDWIDVASTEELKEARGQLDT